VGLKAGSMAGSMTEPMAGPMAGLGPIAAGCSCCWCAATGW